jgi:glucan phosphoethanolaminetransferase (alkaline phosphatase superfamily)
MNEVVSTRRLALAGSIGPVLFVVTVIVITVLEWDFLHRLGWHLVEDSSIVYPSATAMGPYGWLHTVNSLQVGLSIIATAIGLSRTTGARVGAGFVFLGGLGMVLSMFTTDGTSDQPTTWHGVIHDLAYLLLGAVVLAVQLRNQARWRRVARAAIAVPIVIIATFFLAGGLKQAGGLLSILGLLVIFGWYELLALRLLGLVTKPLSPGSVLSM